MAASLWSLRDRILLLLGVAGIGIAGYLTYVKLADQEAFCAGVGNCQAVQNSVYAELLGIPVALLGLLVYIGLLILLLVKVYDWQGLQEIASQLFFVGTLLGFLFSLYLTYLELFVLLEICPWCVASALVLTAMFILAIIEMVGTGRAEDEGYEIEPRG